MRAHFPHRLVVAPLRQRLAELPKTVPLYPLFGLLDAHCVAQADTRVSPDAATHQFVGRLNILADLRAEVVQPWKSAHEG